MIGAASWFWPVLAGMALTAAVTASGLVWWRRRQRNLIRRLRLAALDHAENRCVADGNGGEITLPELLLTASGILVIEIREVSGNIFGSEGMQDWTVMAPRQRYTFSNPQPAVWDRVAAIKRIVPDVPVDGLIAFDGDARFPKGMPRSAALLGALVRELEAARLRESAGRFRSDWDRLLSASTPQTRRVPAL